MMDMNQAVPAIGGLDWGALRSMEPASDRWGFDRGLPIDRHYIERFLARHAQDIRGRCVEVMNANYVRRFGGTAVDSVDVSFSFIAEAPSAARVVPIPRCLEFLWACS